MKAERTIATYRRLRTQPLWGLLAADLGPTVVGLLQTHLLENERSLPASILQERIGQDLEDLRARGDNLPQTAQAYIADWLAKGYLERRFPPGASEEEYLLSAAAVRAIRFIAGLDERRAAATESRLAIVMHQLLRLAEETDPNPASRIAALTAERARIEREIAAVRRGDFKMLEEAQALERAREIIVLADELVADFQRVRDEFEHLNRSLRERILENDGNRGEVLDALFAGVDVIADSEAGRSFAAFWRLLTDPEQSASLEFGLQEVMARPFAARLELIERRFMLRLTRTLLTQGGTVHDVLQNFARSLKHFVQSREYLEQRRLNQVLREAQAAALSLKDSVRATDPVDYILRLTSSRVRSLSQWVLYDPTLHAVDGHMQAADGAVVDIDTVGELIAQSEIDFRALKSNIRAVLDEQPAASIGEVLDFYPATQGLGSVVGYLALGSRHGVRADGVREQIHWVGTDDAPRVAHIPVIYFLKERARELL